MKARSVPTRWVTLYTLPYLPDMSRRMTDEEFIQVYPEHKEWLDKIKEENRAYV